MGSGDYYGRGLTPDSSSGATEATLQQVALQLRDALSHCHHILDICDGGAHLNGPDDDGAKIPTEPGLLISLPQARESAQYLSKRLEELRNKLGSL